jgi:phosphoribosylaminoimidazolecarboxamide formyltransferase/IMP cyclohydrolase
VHDDLSVAFARAIAGDPVSAYGGIVALNRPVDAATVDKMSDVFFEVIVAPGFEPDALEKLLRRRNLRLLAVDPAVVANERWTVRAISGGFLVQQSDRMPFDPSSWTVASKRTPTDEERRDLIFAWQVCRSVKSNAIVLASDRAVTGVGSGQPNRVESVRIAVSKAGDRAPGSVLASDAYFPFADGLQTAIAAGITAAVQPGGSIRDEEVIQAADAAGVAMFFTGERHFLH